MIPDDNDGEVEDAHVPLFGTWRKAYAVVIAAFAADVALFYAISRIFA